MKNDEQLKQIAQEHARRLFAVRLERAGIHTSGLDQLVQCEPTEPQAYDGGVQVRVRTWRHWSDAGVDLDADTAEVYGITLDRLSDPPTHAELAEDEALRIARGLIDVPGDARLRSVRPQLFAEGRRMMRVEWEHVYKGLRVDGDFLWVLFHPRTHKLVAYARKWRTVRLT